MSIQPILAALFCAALASSAMAASKPIAGNAEAGKAKAAACGGCHGTDGNSAPEIYAALKAPKLAGQLPEYIVKSLHDFKAGRRVNESMSPQAQAVAGLTWLILPPTLPARRPGREPPLIRISWRKAKRFSIRAQAARMWSRPVSAAMD
jgi:hypothetical protein